MSRDLRFVCRSLLRHPLHAFLTICVLTLAIGANATVFSVYNGLYLRPLPYPDGDRLVVVYNSYPGLGLEYAGTSIPDYLDRRERSRALEDLGLYRLVSRTLGGDPAPERVDIVRATPSLFSTLGANPLLGRLFDENDVEAGRADIVVLSHALWSTRYGARADIVGSDIEIDGQPATVVGVMPPEFGFPTRDVLAWQPFIYTPAQTSDSSRGQEFSASIGRLRPGASIETLNAEFDRIVRENIDDGRMPQTREGLEATGFTGRARTLRDTQVGDSKQGVLLLQGIVLAVLLIACANVTNFQLARLESRRRELSVRRALGAGLGRVTRLVVVESLLLAACSGVAGLALAYVGLDLVRALGLDVSNAGFDYVIDAGVIGFALATVLTAAVVSVLLPLWVLVRDDAGRTFAESARPAHGRLGAARLRGALVIAQIGVSVSLLVAGGLLLQGFRALQQEGPGFAAENVWSGRIAFPVTRYSSPESRRQFLDEALRQLASLPGVASAAYTSNLPFGSMDSQGSYAIERYELPPDAPEPHGQQRAVSPAFFDVLGVPILQGRAFRQDESDAVVIVDQQFVDRYFPDGDVLGRRIREDFGPDDPWYTIVGVVPAVKHSSLDEDLGKETLYWHYAQSMPFFGSFVLRSRVPPDELTRLASATLLAIDPLMALSDVQTLDTRVARSMGSQRAPMVLVLLFGLAALALAMIGIYGILTWAVTHRVSEIGVRMALGARAADIVRMVLGQGGRLVAAGLGVGLLGAWLLGRVVAGQVSRVEAFDPWLAAAVVCGLAATAFVASWLPARRASRIDPMSALRDE